MTSRDLGTRKIDRPRTAGGENAAIGIVAGWITGDLPSPDQSREIGLASPAITGSADTPGATVARQLGCIDVEKANETSIAAAQRVAINRNRRSAEENGH